MISKKHGIGPLLRVVATTPGVRISAMATSTATAISTAATTLEPLDQPFNF